MTRPRMIEYKVNITEDITDSSLKSLKSTVDDLIKNYGEDANFYITIEQVPYDNYPVPIVYLTSVRPETAKERKQREQIEIKKKEDRRKTYEKLKKEFGEK